MDRTELQALIDRVIGKKGILRAPSWWVRRLFGNLMDYTDTAVESAKEYTDTAVSNIEIDVDAEISDTSENPVQNKVVKAAIDAKQDLLVSGTNIKTFNNESILGEGNITIEGGGDIDTELSDTSENAVQNKAIKAYVDGLVGEINTVLDTINGEEI